MAIERNAFRNGEAPLRVLAEDAVQESQQFAQGIIAALPLPVYLFDLSKRKNIYLSPQVFTVFGYTADELHRSGINLLPQFFHPDDQPRIQTYFAEIEASRDDRLFEIECRMQHKDGTWIWIRCVDSVYQRDAHGAPVWLLGTAEDITARKHAEIAVLQAQHALEQRVAERNAALQRVSQARQQLLGQLVSAQEHERQRIARELHDQTGQSLTALRLGMNALQRMVPAALTAQVARLAALAEQIDDDLDRIALELRPSLLDDLGLREALQQHTCTWSRQHGVATEFAQVGPDSTRLLPEIEVVVYRVTQEALNNIAKHADAQRVSVILDVRPRSVSLVIEDDGRGFDLEAAQTRSPTDRRLGLLGMQERVALVGGTVTVETAPGAGTTLYVRVPLVPVQEDLYG